MSKIQFDSASKKYFFIDTDGKKRASADIGYVAARFAQSYEHLFNGQSEFSLEVNGQSGPEVEEFDINQRFDFIADYVKMVCDGIQPSIVVTGPGGLGKSYTVHAAMIESGFIDCSDVAEFADGESLPANRFRVIKGFSTAKALYRTLYENRDSVLIFDDCDSVLMTGSSGTSDAVNLLKGALDTNAERIICWNAEASFGDDLPRSFRFNGGVIFISNLAKEKIPQALRTRSVCIDVSMTTEQKIQRMETIVSADHFMPEVESLTKTSAINLIRQYQHVANDISMRSLIQVIRIGMKYTGEKFENLAKYALTN